MFEIVISLMSTFIGFIPYLIGLWLIFGFIGDLIFGGRF